MFCRCETPSEPSPLARKKARRAKRLRRDKACHYERRSSPAVVVAHQIVHFSAEPVFETLSTRPDQYSQPEPAEQPEDGSATEMSSYEGDLTEMSEGDTPFLTNTTPDLEAILIAQRLVPDQDECWSIESETRLLKGKERNWRATRPLTTPSESWPHAITQHPIGRHEMPAASVSTLEADHGHGVGNNMIPEREDIARMQELPFMNRPAERARRTTTPTQTLLNGRKPAKGCFTDLFTRPGKKYLAFSPREHGEHTLHPLHTTRRYVSGDIVSRVAGPRHRGARGVFRV